MNPSSASRPTRLWMGILLALLAVGAGVAAGWIFWFLGAPPAPTGGILSTSTSSGSLSPAPAPVVGAPAPDFTLPGVDGLPVHLAGLRGSVVILNFWATWCDPCREELPLLDQAAADNKALHVLAVESGESPDAVKTFLTTLPLPSVTVLTSPDSKVAWNYLVRGIPTTFFIDRDGTIQNIQTGALDPDELDSILRQLGAKP